MLLPQFSFRTLMIGVAAAAVASLVIASAINGQSWAISVLVGASAIAVCFVLFFLSFAVAFGFTAVVGALRPKRRATPFSAEAPQQVLPTHDAD